MVQGGCMQGSCWYAYWNMKQFYLICNLGLYNAIRRFREKCHEIRVVSLACNRPTLDRRVRAAGGLCRPHCLYDVTTIPTSVYVVSLIKVLLSCSRVSTAVCHTIWLNTDAISIDITIRRQCVATTGPVRLSVSDLPPQGLQASRQSLMGHQGVKIFDNPKKSILSKR